MKKLFLILFLFICSNYLKGQDSIQLPSCKYQSWVSVINTELKIKGIIYEVRDTSVVMMHFLKTEDTGLRKLTISNINYNMINIIQTRRMQAPLAGVLYGCVGGCLVGGIYGHSIGKDSFPLLYTIGDGILGGILGLGIGALVGTHRNQFIINGYRGNFEASKAKLKKYSYLH
jgi:hypothetical protein